MEALLSGITPPGLARAASTFIIRIRTSIAQKTKSAGPPRKTCRVIQVNVKDLVSSVLCSLQHSLQNMSFSDPHTVKPTCDKSISEKNKINGEQTNKESAYHIFGVFAD